jgi:hypothetical protein
MRKMRMTAALRIIVCEGVRVRVIRGYFPIRDIAFNINASNAVTIISANSGFIRNAVKKLP